MACCITSSGAVRGVMRVMMVGDGGRNDDGGGFFVATLACWLLLPSKRMCKPPSSSSNANPTPSCPSDAPEEEGTILAGATQGIVHRLDKDTTGVWVYAKVRGCVWWDCACGLQGACWHSQWAGEEAWHRPSQPALGRGAPTHFQNPQPHVDSAHTHSLRRARRRRGCLSPLCRGRWARATWPFATGCLVRPGVYQGWKTHTNTRTHLSGTTCVCSRRRCSRGSVKLEPVGCVGCPCRLMCVWHLHFTV